MKHEITLALRPCEGRRDAVVATAVYDEREASMMRSLHARALQGDAEAANEMFTIHELKVAFAMTLVPEKDEPVVESVRWPKKEANDPRDAPGQAQTSLLAPTGTEKFPIPDKARRKMGHVEPDNAAPPSTKMAAAGERDEPSERPSPDREQQSQLPPDMSATVDPRVTLHRNPDFSDAMLLGEVRDRLAPLVLEGAVCPACGCLAKVIRRNVHSSQARGLILLYRAGADKDFIHAAGVTSSANSDIAKSVWWGLIEEESIRRPDGGRAGWYRLTDLGVRFVCGETTITKYAHTFNKEVVWRSGDQVTIRDCLNNRFDYNELMGRTAA